VKNHYWSIYWETSHLEKFILHKKEEIPSFVDGIMLLQAKAYTLLSYKYSTESTGNCSQFIEIPNILFKLFKDIIVLPTELNTVAQESRYFSHKERHGGIATETYMLTFGKKKVRILGSCGIVSQRL
jgi:hypothetical protein